MRVLIVFLSLSFPCMAESSVDEFTKQEIPASGKGVPKVVLSGNQVKNIQYAEVDGKPLLLDLSKSKFCRPTSMFCELQNPNA